MRRRAGSLPILALAAALAGSAQAQVAWTPAPLIPNRVGHGLAHDSARGVTVLFGGYTGAFGYDTDTWEWDGATWTRRQPATRPPGRSDTALVYDPVRARAAKGLAIGRKRASELLATGRRLAELPRLEVAFGDGTLSWRKVRLVARVATAATEVARAREVTSEELGAMVKVADEGDDPPDLGRGLPQARFEVQLSLNRAQHELLDATRTRSSSRRWAGAQAWPSWSRRRCGCCSRAMRTAACRGVRRWTVRCSAWWSPRTRRRRIRRGGGHERRRRERAAAAAGDRAGRRAVPGLREPAQSDGAPRVWRSRGGPTVADNLVTLCARCHGLVHEGLLQVAGAPGRWRMADRRGRPLERPFPGGGTPRLTQRWSRPAAASSSAEDGARREAFSLADVLETVHARWFREHQHLFDLGWEAGKLTMHLSEPRRRRRA